MKFVKLSCRAQKENYFKEIDEKIKTAYEISEKARKLGFDPEPKVDIPLARNIAERVTGLISTVAPQVVNTKIPNRIIELEKEYGNQDWRVALKIAEEVANQKHCKFDDKKQEWK